jgi:hypothetical protein
MELFIKYRKLIYCISKQSRTFFKYVNRDKNPETWETSGVKSKCLCKDSEWKDLLDTNNFLAGRGIQKCRNISPT